LLVWKNYLHGLRFSTELEVVAGGHPEDQAQIEIWWYLVLVSPHALVIQRTHSHAKSLECQWLIGH